MRAGKLFIKLSITTVILFLIFSTAACLERKASSSTDQNHKVEKSDLTVSANPELNRAQELIEKAPDSPTGYSQLAIAYIRAARENGDFSLNSKAETAVDRALRIEPDNAAAQKLHSSLLLTFHRFTEALEEGKKLQSLYPQDPFIYGVLTDADVELGNYEDAAKAVQKMVDLRPNMESYARVSYVRSLYGDTDGAIEAMGMAARMADPADKEAQAWCLVHLGNEYYKAGRYEEAETVYDSALKILPGYYFALAGKGQTRRTAGDYENAIRLLNESQNRVPLTQTVIELGDLYKKTGDLEKADEQYKLVEVIEQKLGLNNDQRNLALFWADHDLKLDEAMAIMMREHANRKDVYTADIYAWCLYKKGNFREAKAAITEAMRIKNKDARIFYHAGMIEKALNNKKEADRFLQKALQTNPSFDLLQAENAQAALQELK